MKALSWVNVFLGVWMIVAAFALSTGDRFTMAEDSVAGIMITVLAYASSVGPAAPGISWSVALAGLWTLIGNYGVRNPAHLNATVVGFLVLMLGAANAMYRRTARIHA